VIWVLPAHRAGQSARAAHQTCVQYPLPAPSSRPPQAGHIWRAQRQFPLTEPEPGKTQAQILPSIEADAYDPQTRSGWSVLVHGRAEVVYEDAEVQRLSELGLHPWARAVDRPFWVRIRPTVVSGRQVPASEGSSG
jgi:Pyridoxamine 5'-phosphate oxidase